MGHPRSCLAIALALAAGAAADPVRPAERSRGDASGPGSPSAAITLQDVATTGPSLVRLPLPDGSWERFRLEPYPVMAPGLARRFPQIRAYRGHAARRPGARAWVSTGPNGTYAAVSADGRTLLLEPDPEHGVDAYRAREESPARGAFCSTPAPAGSPPAVRGPRKLPLYEPLEAGDTLRTYRIAIASSGGYTSLHGATVQGGLAAIVALVTYVNSIFERDLSIRFELVDGNDRLIYTNAVTDPYTDGNDHALWGENQANLDAVLGSGAYDIGHVLTWPLIGSVERVGSVCLDEFKGAATSGWHDGDVFGIAEIVMHEIGHQMGAGHTFNSGIENCGRQRFESSAWEPGSGSTMMSYAARCGVDMITSIRSRYFHSGSFGEIRRLVEVGAGSRCGIETETGNEPPEVDAGRDYRIPARTPFVLTGRSEDEEALVHRWEQYDLGPPSPPMNDDGQRPIFRSWDPVPEPLRELPRLGHLLDGTLAPGEAWPTTNRALTFRFVAQDGLGGTAIDTMVLDVVADAGPFAIRAPAGGTVWAAGRRARVSWDVAGTRGFPIRCRRVNVSMSTDGGATWPAVLARRTRNDGSVRVRVPELPTRQARVRIDCANNVFFAVSPGNFRVDG